MVNGGKRRNFFFPFSVATLYIESRISGSQNASCQLWQNCSRKYRSINRWIDRSRNICIYFSSINRRKREKGTRSRKLEQGIELGIVYCRKEKKKKGWLGDEVSDGRQRYKGIRSIVLEVYIYIYIYIERIPFLGTRMLLTIKFK